MSVKKLVLASLFSALALVVFIIENALPPLIPFAPGVKLGLSNVFIMLAVVFCGKLPALAVAIVKSVLGSIFSGNMFSLVYSFPASLASLGVFILLYQFLYKSISVVGMSVIASMMFNLSQIITAAMVLSSSSVFLYLPYVLLIGTLMGMFTGAVVYFIVKTVKKPL